jgi:hypothetical protein
LIRRFAAAHALVNVLDTSTPDDTLSQCGLLVITVELRAMFSPSGSLLIDVLLHGGHRRPNTFRGTSFLVKLYWFSFVDEGTGLSKRAACDEELNEEQTATLETALLHAALCAVGRAGPDANR